MALRLNHQVGPVLEIGMLKQVRVGYLAEIILKVFVIIFASPFEIGVLLSGMIDHTHFVDVSVHFAIREVSAKMRVFEGIVVW